MPARGPITSNSYTESVRVPRDRALAELADRQHGVVARRQLMALGFSNTVVAYSARIGRLHRLHHGVYAVGHTVLGANGRRMAAVLAGGPAAALFRTSAGALWEMRQTAAATIHVAVRNRGGRSRAGLRIHRVPSLRPEEVTTHRGIPVTTPERTLLDLAATLERRQLERALDQAEILRLIDYSALDAVIRNHASHRGASRLTGILTTHRPGTTLTKSELEEAFLHLCETHHLPRPGINTYVENLEVDFVFHEHRVAVETDGWHYHRTRRAFERDRERDATLTRAGYRTLRFTHRQITHEPATVAATVAAAFSPAPE